jgi:hypothetical protein
VRTLNAIADTSSVIVDQNVLLSIRTTTPTAFIAGANLVLGGAPTLTVGNGPTAVDLRINSTIDGGAAASLKKEVTCVRESRAPIVQGVRGSGKQPVQRDVKTVVPELQNSSFGAIIEVLNDVPIAVERSLYWDANGAFWAGGTNALATRLPPVK